MEMPSLFLVCSLFYFSLGGPSICTTVHEELASPSPRKDLLKQALKICQFNAVDDQGNTMLHVAISNPKLKGEILRKLLDKSDLRARNNAGQTPMHLAVRRGELWIVEELEERGATDTLLMEDKDGLSPLGWASTEASKEMTRALVKMKRKWDALQPEECQIKGAQSCSSFFLNKAKSAATKKAKKEAKDAKERKQTIKEEPPIPQQKPKASKQPVQNQEIYNEVKQQNPPAQTYSNQETQYKEPQETPRHVQQAQQAQETQQELQRQRQQQQQQQQEEEQRQQQQRQRQQEEQQTQREQQQTQQIQQEQHYEVQDSEEHTQLQESEQDEEDLDDMMSYDELMDKKISQWTLEDVILWLDSLGMDQEKTEDLITKFSFHGVNGPILLQLSDRILKEDIDVLSFGTRHFLLESVKHLEWNQKSTLEKFVSEYHYTSLVLKPQLNFLSSAVGALSALFSILPIVFCCQRARDCLGCPKKKKSKDKLKNATQQAQGQPQDQAQAQVPTK